MIQLPERPFGYFLIQCADEERSEVLNVGVVAYDVGERIVECRFANSLDRIQRTLPNVPVPQVRVLLEHAQEAAARLYERGGIAALAALSEEPRGSLRFTELRSVSARRLDRVADELLERYVEMPARGVAHGGTTRYSDLVSDAANRPTSRRVINSVETRLRRRYNLRAGADYETGVTLEAKVANAIVPIWFPLRFKNDLFLDGLEVKADLNRTIDNARAIALKVQEAHRVRPQARMSILIRDPGMETDGEAAKAVLEEGAGAAREVLEVSRYAEPGQLDYWMERTLEPAFM